MSEGDIIHFVEFLLEFDKKSALDFLKEKADSADFINFFSEVITGSLEKIGKMWEKGLVSLSQVYMSGRICEDLVNHFFKDRGYKNNSPLKIAAVTYEDHHNLGKIITKSILRSVGYEVEDIGSGKGHEEIVKICKEKNYDVLLLSTLILDAALNVKKLTERIKEENLKTKVVVGGAPFLLNKELWKKVGADSVGFTASDAIEILNKIERGDL